MAKVTIGKNLDGLNTGNFDSLYVSGNTVMDGNLSVAGLISGVVIASTSTANYFTATDSTNQWRVNSSTFDLKSTTSNPTFRLLNNSNSSTLSTLQVGTVASPSITSTTMVTTTLLASSSITSSGTANVTGLMTSGSLNTGTATITTLNATTTSGTSATYSGLMTSGTLATGSGTVTGLLTTGSLTTGATSVSTLTVSSTLTGAGANFSGTVSAGDYTGSPHFTTTNTTTLAVSGDATTGSLTSGTTSAGEQTITIQNTNGAGISILRFANNVASQGVIFKTGSTYSGGDGPANGMTIRNDAGVLRLSDNTGTLVTISSGTITANAAYSITSLATTTSIAAGTTLSSTTTTAVGTNLTVGGTSTLTGILNVTNTTDATSAAAGAIQTAGGIKAQKKVYAATGTVVPYGQAYGSDTNHTVQTKMMDAQFSASGGLLYDALYLYAPGSTSGAASTSFVLGANAQSVLVPQTTACTSTTTGALIVNGGVGIAGNVNIGGTLTAGAVVYASTSSGTFDVTNGTGTTLTVQSTQASTSTTTGCATFNGGVGVAGNLYVGGTLSAGTVTYATTSTGTMAVTNDPGTTFTVASTLDATSTTAAAATVAGGLGVGKSIYVGGGLVVGTTSLNGNRNLVIQNTNANGVSALVYTNDIAGTTDLFLLPSIYGSDFYIRNLRGNAYMYGSGNSGIAIFPTRIYHQLTYENQNTTDATSISAASAIFNGGVGIAKSTRIGLNLYVGDTASAANGSNTMAIRNQTASGQAALTFDTDAVGNGNMFMNGSAYVGGDGTANMLTIRNDAGDLRLQGSSNTMTFTSGIINSTKFAVTDTTASTSTTTGSLVTGGGFGCAGSGYFGGTVTAASFVGSYSPSSLTITGASGTTLTVNSTTDSTTHTNGAVYVAGGVGIEKSLNCGNDGLVGDNAIAGDRSFTIKNNSTANNASSTLYLQSASGNKLALYLNGTGHSAGQGGPNTATLINNAGDLHLHSAGGSGIVITTSTITNQFDTTVPNLTNSGTYYGKLFSSSSSGLTDAAYQFANTTSGTETCAAHFYTGLTNGQSLSMTLGYAQSSDNSMKFKYTYNNTTGLRTGNIGFCDVDALTFRNGDGGSVAGGLSIYGGAYFTYTEGSLTPSVVGIGVGATNINIVSSGAWCRMGKMVTVSFKISWTHDSGPSGFYLTGLLPVSTTVYPEIHLDVDYCDITNISKPYYLQYSRTYGGYVCAGYNGSFISNTGDASLAGTFTYYISTL